MTIYIDENMSPYLAKGFQILQTPENIRIKQPIHVESTNRHYLSNIPFH